jgi:hypothetical protein
MALWLRKILTDLGLTPKGGRQQRGAAAPIGGL